METQHYEFESDIRDAVILEEFQKVSVVKFSARRFNSIQYRSIGIGSLEWWIPLRRVLPLLGITPSMLLPVFGTPTKWYKKQPWSRLVPVKAEQIDTVSSYDDLGVFPLAEGSFVKFVRVLGKSIEVWREDGGTGEHHLLFTAHPSGEITRE